MAKTPQGRNSLALGECGVKNQNLPHSHLFEAPPMTRPGSSLKLSLTRPPARGEGSVLNKMGGRDQGLNACRFLPKMEPPRVNSLDGKPMSEVITFHKMLIGCMQEEFKYWEFFVSTYGGLARNLVERRFKDLKDQSTEIMRESLKSVRQGEGAFLEFSGSSEREFLIHF